jgi:cell division protein FtsL
MEAITLLIAVVALIISILAYQRSGGIADMKRQVESATSSVDLKKQIESLGSMTDALRGKTADALDRLEKVIRKTEKEKVE